MMVCSLLLACQSCQPAFAIEISEVRQAVVHLDGGSGVCVSPDGWVITAAHMLPGWPFDPPHLRPRHNPWLPGQTPPLRRPPTSVSVTWETGQRLQAAVCVIQDTDERSDLVILKANGSNLPFRPVATKAPAVGDAVFCAGYPNGNWAWNEARITRIGPINIGTNLPGRQTIREVLDMSETSYRANPGGSGGPLLNQRMEVIGICSRATSAGPQLTNFSRWEHITACLLKAGYSPMSDRSAMRLLGVWKDSSIPNCAGCIRFDSDLAAGIDCNGQLLQIAFRVQYFDVQQSPELAAKLGIVAVPAFVVDGAPPILGYPEVNGKEWLVNQLCQYQFPIVGKPAATAVVPVPATPVPTPESEAGTPEKPAEEEAETPVTVDETPDPTLIRVILLLEKRGSLGSFSLIKGIALSKVERIAENKLPEKVKELLGDKVRAEIVFQRRNPSRYDELTTAAAVPGAQIVAVVLVGQKFEGVAAKLSSCIEGKLQDLAASHGETLDVEVIFERLAEERYHSVLTALDEEEPTVSDEQITLAGAGTTAGSASGGLWAWFKRRRLMRAGVA